MSQPAPRQPSLADLLPAPPAPGADLAPAAAFVVGRPERDRLVIFDPTSAPLIRPLIRAADLRPWHAAPSDSWAIAIPAGYTARLAPGAPGEAAAFAALAARHPALARHLQPHAEAARERASSGDFWWELFPEPLAAAGPRILIGLEGAAWDESGALLAAPALGIPGADPYVLALLWAYARGTSTARAWGREGAQGPAPRVRPPVFESSWYPSLMDLLQLPAPDAPAPQRASLGGLALSAANLAGQLAEQERAVLRRLLADFGPPGAAAGPRLTRWWELEYAELRAALRADLRNDIPERFRPTWEQIHAQQRADHAAAADQLAQVEAAIDGQVAALIAAQ